MSTDIDGVALWKLYVFPTAKKKWLKAKKNENVAICRPQKAETRLIIKWRLRLLAVYI